MAVLCILNKAFLMRDAPFPEDEPTSLPLPLGSLSDFDDLIDHNPVA